MPTVVIAAGGTAGHVVPAIAVADALRDKGADVFFVGTEDRVEADLVPAAGYEIDFLKVRGIERRHPVKAVRAMTRVIPAVFAARKLLAGLEADVVMGGGGYVAGPVGLAALDLHLPLILTEADRHLGLANRMLARRARRVCLAFPIPDRKGDQYMVTGRPVGRAVLNADRDGARRRYGMEPEARCLLVFGGSQGARSINEAAIEAFAAAGAPRDFQVLHIAGHRDYEELKERLDAADTWGYTLLEFEPNLGDALAASDLVLARAGGSVFEIAAAGRPAILVPYPYATADHQKANAEWMEEAGAAVVLADDELDAERLGSSVRELFANPGRLKGMADASHGLARPDAAERIAEEIVKAAEESRRAAEEEEEPAEPSASPTTEPEPAAPGGEDEEAAVDSSEEAAVKKKRRRFRRKPRETKPDGAFGGRQLHFIAIGGAGMSGLALAAYDLGADVTGSDRAESPYLDRLRDAGLEPELGHDATAVPEDAEVVISTAIPDDNPELERARQRGQKVIHRGELLAEIAALHRVIAVAGTHGKTTTAGMIAHALTRLDADPSFLLGGELLDRGNASLGDGEWIVVEADESDASFLELRPEVAVVTNVELDHHSRWSSRGELEDAFRRFLAPAQFVALGAGESLDRLVPETAEVERFDLDRPGPEQLKLKVPGDHNVLNARAAIAALELAGFEPERVATALADFPGIRRRLELKGQAAGARVYDDYAHHPTEVEAALRAARDLLNGEGRLIAVFQPHLYSRTKALAREFGVALSVADEIGVLDVYPAREEPVGELEGVSGLAIAEAVSDAAPGRPIWWLVDRDRALRVLRSNLRHGDLLVTLGAGDIDELADALVAGTGA